MRWFGPWIWIMNIARHVYPTKMITNPCWGAFNNIQEFDRTTTMTNFRFCVQFFSRFSPFPFLIHFSGCQVCLCARSFWNLYLVVCIKFTQIFENKKTIGFLTNRGEILENWEGLDRFVVKEVAMSMKNCFGLWWREIRVIFAQNVAFCKLWSWWEGRWDKVNSIE